MRRMSITLFVACFAFAAWSGVGFDTLVICLLGMLLSLSLSQWTEKWVAAAAAGVLAGACCFIKLSIGIGALGMLATACGLALLRVREPKGGWRPLLPPFLGAASFAILFSVLARSYFHSVANLAQWLRISLEIVGGYSTAMSLTGPRREVILGQIGLLSYLALAFCLVRLRSTLRPTLALFALPAFLLFKQGFVRHDGHGLSFFTFLVLLAGVLLIEARERREWRVCLGFLGAWVLIGLLVTMNSWRDRPAPEDVLWRKGPSNIASLLHFSESRQHLMHERAASLVVDRLPADWVREIRSSRQTVGVLPSEIVICAANDLRWQPAPVLQSYSAYTSSLDDLSAAHYAGPEAPGYIVVSFERLGTRHPLFDTPAMWGEIRRHYDVTKIDPESKRLLLKRNASPRLGELRSIQEKQIRSDEWYTVGQTSGLLFMEVRMDLSLIGKLANFAYKIPAVGIYLLHASGKQSKCRIVPDTARHGLPINSMPMDVRELATWLNGSCDDPVVMFELSGAGLSYYREPFTVVFKVMQ